MGQLLPTLLSREASGLPSPPGLAPLSPGACLSNVPNSLCLSASHRPCPALTGAWRPCAVRRHLLRALGLELLRLGGSGQAPVCRGGPSSREGNSVAALESVAHGSPGIFLE